MKKEIEDQRNVIGMLTQSHKTMDPLGSLEVEEEEKNDLFSSHNHDQSK